MTNRVCSFTLKAGTVVSVGGVPVHLGHDTICVSHPDNRDQIEGTAPAPDLPALESAMARWNRLYAGQGRLP